MRVAITGATGFVGSHLADRLSSEGHEVVRVTARLHNLDELAKGFSGCQAVAHCAGINREIGNQTYARVHVEGTRNVVEAAQRAGVEKIGLMSFLRARPDCGSGYHESKWAAEEIVDGAVFNSGQSCCSVERVYVDDKIHDDFVSALQGVLQGYKLGDPMDKSTNVGPVVSARSADTIRSHIKDALEKGARDVTPDNASFKSPPAEGNYVAPTLLINVNHDMAVMTEETFGPVIPVMRVKNDEEAIKLMNDSQFGLTASIWTKDVGKGHELIDDVEAGTVFVNRCDYPAPVSFASQT